MPGFLHTWAFSPASQPVGCIRAALDRRSAVVVRNRLAFIDARDPWLQRFARWECASLDSSIVGLENEAIEFLPLAGGDICRAPVVSKCDAGPGTDVA